MSGGPRSECLDAPGCGSEAAAVPGLVRHVTVTAVLHEVSQAPERTSSLLPAPQDAGLRVFLGPELPELSCVQSSSQCLVTSCDLW